MSLFVYLGLGSCFPCEISSVAEGVAVCFGVCWGVFSVRVRADRKLRCSSVHGLVTLAYEFTLQEGC